MFGDLLGILSFRGKQTQVVSKGMLVSKTEGLWSSLRAGGVLGEGARKTRGGGGGVCQFGAMLHS